MILLALVLACAQPDTQADTGSPDPGSQATYRAQATIGALNRVALVRESQDLCVVLGLVQPGGAPPFELSLPEGWSVEFAWADQRTNTEPCWSQAPADPSWCHQGQGSLDFQGHETTGIPTSLDADLTLAWPDSGQTWLPETLHLQATGVAVSQQ